MFRVKSGICLSNQYSQVQNSRKCCAENKLLQEVNMRSQVNRGILNSIQGQKFTFLDT